MRYVGQVPSTDTYYQAVLTWRQGWYGSATVAFSDSCNATDALGIALQRFPAFNFTATKTALVRYAIGLLIHAEHVWHCDQQTWAVGHAEAASRCHAEPLKP